jgi:general stress protein 26
MGDVKNLQGNEAAEKVKELAEVIKTCIFCTYDGDILESRPMSTRQADDEGNLWFLSDKNDVKIRQIERNSKVEVLFAEGESKFMAIHGTATILYDKEKIKELWAPIAKIWFKDGVDDPNIAIIKVQRTGGYYWDTKHGKMVELAIMAAALASGKTMDDGIEGKLS